MLSLAVRASVPKRCRGGERLAVDVVIVLGGVGEGVGAGCGEAVLAEGKEEAANKRRGCCGGQGGPQGRGRYR